MNGEGLSNCEAELKPSLSDYVKLQTKYIEEKEKSLNLEKKIFYLENGLKEKEKQTFQQIIDEKMKEVENKSLKEKEKNEKEMNEVNWINNYLNKILEISKNKIR
ncbi:unnamed protein product [Meloidogyne enterolobii]|uniref:Uncharacterized protein n=1 Tax=Meloidogyne enterolobii TaxID=390850 RepID=A0ACB0XLI6_MELEN